MSLQRARHTVSLDLARLTFDEIVRWAICLDERIPLLAGQLLRDCFFTLQAIQVRSGELLKLTADDFNRGLELDTRKRQRFGLLDDADLRRLV